MQKILLKNPLFVVFCTIFIDMLGFGILIPVIPLLLADTHSPYYLLPASISPSQGYILLGFLTAVFPLGQFFATPILGQLSDKFGRKNILAISLTGTFLSYVLFAIGIIANNIPLLFVARFLDGITGGNISVAQAAVADITTPQNRAKNFGLIGAAFGLGFIFGPYLGGKLSDPTVISWFSVTTPFWFAALLSLCNVLSVLFVFPETLKDPRTSLPIHWPESLKNIHRAFRMKELRSLFATNFLFQGGFAFFTTFFSVFLIHRFGFSQGNVGDFFSYVGIWIVITQVFITRKVASHLDEQAVLRLSFIATGIFMLTFFIPEKGWQLLLVAPCFAIFNGLSQANLTGLISRSAAPEVQGEVLGINASVQALAQSLPPILSGLIAAQLAPSAPIAVSAFIIMTSGLVFIYCYRPKTE